jgi:hypothetical protein
VRRVGRRQRPKALRRGGAGPQALRRARTNRPEGPRGPEGGDPQALRRARIEPSDRPRGRCGGVPRRFGAQGPTARRRREACGRRVPGRLTARKDEPAGSAARRGRSVSPGASRRARTNRPETLQGGEGRDPQAPRRARIEARKRFTARKGGPQAPHGAQGPRPQAPRGVGGRRPEACQSAERRPVSP